MNIKASILIITAVLFNSLFGSVASQSGIEKISVSDKDIIFKVSHIQAECEILVIRPYQDYSDDGNFPIIWKGRPEKTIKLPRFENDNDRLFLKFCLIDAISKKIIGQPQYITDFSSLTRRNCKIYWPKSIKGLACIRDVNDAIDLGVKSANHNVTINDIIRFDISNPEMVWQVDGQQIPINMGYIRQLDDYCKKITDAGINLTLILLNVVPRTPQPSNLLIHPNTDLVNNPWQLGAFNLTDDQGLKYYRAALEFLADRYTRPDKKFGQISGIIIGNEIQHHWIWYNIGDCPADKVIQEYSNALRVAYLASQKYHSDLRIYASLDHDWTVCGDINEPSRSIVGKELLTGINDSISREGNFPWNVAFHPYPENLFEPRFWDDKRVSFDFNTPKITFKNLEVFAEFISQPQFLYQGKPRRIILSEQGFHTPSTPEGQQIQAACYAYAYYKVKHMNLIDSFMYFTQVSSDNTMSGGLRLGLRDWDPNGSDEFNKCEKKYIWNVFKDADTDLWEKSFEFAKPIIGIKNWDEVLPKKIALKESIKGLSCIVDIDDAVELGVKYCHENFLINKLINWRELEPKVFYELDGYKIGLNRNYITELDERFKKLNRGGIKIILVVLNQLSDSNDPNDPLIHPDTDRLNSPTGLAAFNTANQRGIRYYRAAIEFLTDRYTRKDEKYGRVSGLIIGNEIQSHWSWYNIGLAEPQKVIENYESAVRYAYLSSLKSDNPFDIYISMDHVWTKYGTESDPLKGLLGRDFLVRFNEIATERGNFPWAVAFHPYPDNMFDPRFWLEDKNVLDFNTPKITFNNIEVLPEFLRQSQFLYDGKIRKIILSEQGFHTPDGNDGELIQAAAYAYAYYKISHIPQISAFILHRHVDHPQECGLWLGLWKCNLSAKHPEQILFKKKYIWNVFKDADTDLWEKSFEFAKPIIGIKKWDEVLPKKLIIDVKGAQ